MPQFRKVEDLIAYVRLSLYKMVESNTGLALQNFLKEAVSQSVQDNVYDVYEPESYQRRGDKGGLSDPNNVLVYAELTDSGIKLTVENETTGSWENEKISHLIEFGASNNQSNAFWDDPTGEWAQARPFMHILLKDLQSNPNELIEAVNTSLVQSGFRVKKK